MLNWSTIMVAAKVPDCAPTRPPNAGLHDNLSHAPLHYEHAHPLLPSQAGQTPTGTCATDRPINEEKSKQIPFHPRKCTHQYDRSVQARPVRSCQSRAEQSREEQSREEQSRTEQNKAEQNRAIKNKAEQNRAEKRREEQRRAEQNRAEQSRAEKSRTEQNRA